MVYAPRSAAAISHVRSERHIANRVRFSHITRRVSPLTLDLRVLYRPPFTCQTHTTTGQQIRYAQNMRISPALTLVAIPCLILSGCSSDTGSQEQPETITVTQTTMAEEKPAPADEASQANESKPKYPPEETSPPVPEPAAPSGNHNITVGQVGGYCGTTSAGEEIDAYDATSCEFAAAIYDAAMQADFASSGNSTPHVYLDVVSPATGGTYPIDCWPGSSGETLICDNPNDRDVGAYFTGPNGGYWHSKLGLV